jgi:hypothetical protein
MRAPEALVAPSRRPRYGMTQDILPGFGSQDIGMGLTILLRGAK